MQAIILAAGMGKRLKNLTKNNTKCMIKVNGVTLIERMLAILDKRKLSRIIIVVGYKGDALIEYISTLNIKTDIIYIYNRIYDKTNNIYSLSLAKNYLQDEDTLLFESDLIFEESIIDILLCDKRPTLALVDRYESWMDGTCVKLGEDDSIQEFIPGKRFKYSEIGSYYKTVNIYKFSKNFSVTHYVPFLEAYEKALGLNEYYEQVLRVIAMLDNPEIQAKRLSGQLWYEIDDIQDLDIASSIFTQNIENKLSIMQQRYGGYWRYPNLIDFCYLVNPYFPPKRLIDEIKSNLENLITQYPSGANVNTLLASKNFNIQQENIIIANGAAEIIDIFFKYIKGTVGFISPTFEEYINRCAQKKCVFSTHALNFKYGGKEIIDYFSKNHVDNLVIINPDNPSGNYIQKKDMLNVLSWAKEKGINLIIDESFVDFADEDSASIMSQEILEQYKNLYIVKSISKSYGVPGLRLGFLSSGDVELLQLLKKDFPIWNINSIAEFYMQIFEKYKNKYLEAIKLFKIERDRFVECCKEIPGLRVIPTQANYFMVEIKKHLDATTLTKELLDRYNIFIKDLTQKCGKNFVRIAIRKKEDNDKLINALRMVLQ